MTKEEAIDILTEWKEFRTRGNTHCFRSAYTNQQRGEAIDIAIDSLRGTPPVPQEPNTNFPKS
jgi:hypothetical protein